MKHIFVINPCAGKTDASSEIVKKLHQYENKIDYETYVTKRAGDGCAFVLRWCEEHPHEAARFYACGGDGTINEVVTALMDFKRQHPECDDTLWQLSCYPCGSGNDYIKYYASKEDFLDLSRLLNGVPHRVDVMQVNNRYSINVCNWGFEASVCETMIKVKRKPIIGGRNAYTTGIITSLVSSLHHHCCLKVDGKQFYEGDFLLATLCNGQYVGGAYRCAPLSKNDDGKMEVTLFKPMGLLCIAKLIGSYAKGTFHNRAGIEKKMYYCRGTSAEITYDKPFTVIIDGDILHDSHYEVVNLPQALTFVAPVV